MKKVFLLFASLLLLLSIASIGLADKPRKCPKKPHKCRKVIKSYGCQEVVKSRVCEDDDIEEVSPESDSLEENDFMNYPKTYTVRASGDIIGTVEFAFYQSYQPDQSVYSLWGMGDLRLTFHEDFEPIRGLRKDGTFNFLKNRSYGYHYKLNSCEGEPYIYVGKFDDKKSFTVSPPPKGKVFVYQGDLYYYPKDSVIYTFISRSNRLLSDGACSWTNVSKSGELYIKLLPNDPAVTGIMEYPLPVPITIDGMEKAVIIHADD